MFSKLNKNRALKYDVIFGKFANIINIFTKFCYNITSFYERFHMSIEEFIKKIKEDNKELTKAERKQRLIDARILDKNGYYDERYFRAETVEKSKLAIAS